VAVGSILLKEAIYHYTIAMGRKLKSVALVANAWHHRSDAFSSLAVALGIAGAKIRPGWFTLDAFAALVVSLLIIKVGFDILWKAMKELADTAPGPDIQKRIMDCAAVVEGVLGVHDLRARSSGGLFQMELHVVVDGGLTVTQGHRIAKEVENCLIEELENVEEVIVHVDPDTGEGG
jgi:cation diffusion facilitator family transporter